MEQDYYSEEDNDIGGFKAPSLIVARTEEGEERGGGVDKKEEEEEEEEEEVVQLELSRDNSYSGISMRRVDTIDFEQDKIDDTEFGIPSLGLNFSGGLSGRSSGSEFTDLTLQYQLSAPSLVATLSIAEGDEESEDDGFEGKSKGKVIDH